MSSFSARLREERDRLRITQPDFGAHAGVGKQSQINYESGKRSPDADYLMAISSIGVDVLYVLTGRREPMESGALIERHDAASIHARVMAEVGPQAVMQRMLAETAPRSYLDLALMPEDDFTRIPVHDALLAAGNGVHNDSEDLIDHIAFRRSWLQQIGVSSVFAMIATAKGDSMWPTIHDGDAVLIDRQSADMPTKPHDVSGKRPAPIFALLDDGAARIKRLVLAAPGTLALLSDNPTSPPEFRPIDAVSIIGRVRWWGHTNRE